MPAQRGQCHARSTQQLPAEEHENQGEQFEADRQAAIALVEIWPVIRRNLDIWDYWVVLQDERRPGSVMASRIRSCEPAMKKRPAEV